MNTIAAKLRDIADTLDPKIRGIAIVIVGDLNYQLACAIGNETYSYDDERDAMALAMSIEQAIRAGTVKPRKGFEIPSGDNEEQS
jgi:hypothetical protein